MLSLISPEVVVVPCEADCRCELQKKTTAQIKLSPLQQLILHSRKGKSKSGNKSQSQIPEVFRRLILSDPRPGKAFLLLTDAINKSRGSHLKINEAKDLLKSLLETAGSIVKFSFFSPLALKKEEEKKKCSYYYSRNKCETDAKVHPPVDWGGNPEQF